MRSLREEPRASSTYVLGGSLNCGDGRRRGIYFLSAGVDSEGVSDANDGSKSGPELMLERDEVCDFCARDDRIIDDGDAIYGEKRVMRM